MYNWQLSDWPNFKYNINKLKDIDAVYQSNLAFLHGGLASLSDSDRNDVALLLMLAEAVSTSHIEGEYISRQDVMSSIKRQMGLSQEASKDGRAEGITAMLNQLQHTCLENLTEKCLFEWHHLLLNYELYQSSLKVGGWRTHKEAMQIISGHAGKITVHFEAPPSNKVSREMQRYIKWFNFTAPKQKDEIASAAIRAGIAHLYFESIHPFEDGNGRIGRALSEKVLSQHFGQPIPISISNCIDQHKKNYYEALKQAQRSNEITAWLIYFIEMLCEAQQQSKQLIQFIVRKTRFFDQHVNHMNERQTKVVQRMFAQGPDGFQGGMTAKKYIGITRCSKATATRDLTDLLNKKIVCRLEGGGRNVRYALVY